MKITDIQTSWVRFPMPVPFKPSWTPGRIRPYHDLLLVRVYTDAGIVGIGGTVGFFGKELLVAVEERIKPLLVGLDPLQTELIHEHLRGTTVFGNPRPWFVEIACWDAAGKALNQPIYKLLGGSRTKLPAYVSTGELRTVEQRLEDIRLYMEKGFRAIKIRFHHAQWKDDMKIVEAIRKHFGDRLEIMVDANQGWPTSAGDPAGVWTYHTALQAAKALEQYDVYWLEEPLHRHDYEGLARLRANVHIRIAGGEMNCGIHEFRELLRHRSLDVYQPDAVFSGGILDMKKVADMVEADGNTFTPHTWSNGIGLAANLHVAATVSRGSYVEFPMEVHSWTLEARDFMLRQPIDIDRDGHIAVPEGPGLGIELDEEKVAHYTVKG